MSLNYKNLGIHLVLHWSTLLVFLLFLVIVLICCQICAFEFVIITQLFATFEAIPTCWQSGTVVGHLVQVNFSVASSFVKGRECNQAAHELVVLGFLCAKGEEQIC